MSKNKNNTSDNIGDTESGDGDDDFDIEQNPSEADELLDMKSIDKMREDIVPLRSSAEWNNYVMTKFVDDELVPDRRNKEKKYPNVAGLRRVTRLLIGPVTRNITEFKELNPGFAVAESLIVVHDNTLGYDVEFGDVGNCSVKGTKPPYDEHLPSIAATRAESRALRKALELKTLSAEEMAGAAAPDPAEEVNNSSDSTMIEDVQITVIKKMCERNGLGYDKFVRYMCGATPIDKMTKEWGANVLSDLHSYQAKKKDLPEELKNV